ncbi:MAG: FHA domain-containing protein [Acidimicrobiales bacterium]
MSGATCPNGHTSTDPDWCDTCGAPMHGTSAEAAAQAVAPAASGSASSPTGASTVVAPVSCPHCGSINSADNLFCESCGYDFTTGQTPEPPPAATPDPAPSSAAADPAVAVVVPADPAVVAPPTGSTGWTVVVEVDPAWFALKGELADRPLPSPSTSTVPLFGHVSLVGRTSQSRGLRPEIALDTDTAVSRRHAQLLVEDDRLSVVDLSSTNGTYVLDAGQVPTEDAVPLAAGVPAMLDDGDQIYVGAWSRLTVRRT